MATETVTENPTYRRRSTRIVLRVPLAVNVAGASPETQWEPVETVTVSQHGGMIRTQRDFHVGDTLEIRVRNGDRSAQARVAWKSTTITPNGVELGFEILDEDGFWEIKFPDDRWSQGARPSEPNP